MASIAPFTSLVRAELPFSLTRTLHAAGPAIALGSTATSSLDDMFRAASKVRLELPGGGNPTTGALLARDGQFELVPLGLAAGSWEDRALRPVALATLRPESGAVGSNLHSLDESLAGLVHGDDVVRLT